VFAPAEITRDPKWLRVRVNHDHRVRAIFMATAAVVLNGLAGSVLAGRGHRM